MMKPYFTIALLSVFVSPLISCDNSEKKQEISTDLIENPATATDEQTTTEDLPQITFEQEVFSFGQITQGEKVEYSFRFMNTGKSDLIITSARGSCGCTVPSWPKEPIAPGASGTVDVVFNSNGKQGQQHKKITLVTNCMPNTTVIALKGEVLIPKE